MKQKSLKSIPIHYYTNHNKEKETILFLHPAFANHMSFHKQFVFFSDNYNMIALDMIGHGASQEIKTNQKIHNSSDHIKEILDIEKISKLHLVGVSLGALIAQDFANQYPQNIISLCPIGGYDINHFDKTIEKQSQKQQLQFMFKMLVSMKWFSESNSKLVAITADAQERFYQMNKHIKRSSLKYMSTLNQIMNRYAANERPYPLSIFYGEFDNDLAIALSKQWYKSEPVSAIKMIPDAGHCANMDNPDLFNQLLLEHLHRT